MTISLRESNPSVGVAAPRPGLVAKGGRDRARLELGLQLQRVEIERRRRAEGDQWADAAMEYRRIAHVFADHGALDEAWAALKAADRELIHAYDSAERLAEALRVRFEAETKLLGWRKKFVERRLLGVGGNGQPASPTTRLSADTLIQCRLVLDGALDNRFRQLSVLRFRVRWSAFSVIATLLLVLAAWLIAERSGLTLDDATSVLTDWRSILVVLSLGALGASLSSLLSLRDRRIDARMPDLSEGWMLNVWRPVLGAGSAFALVLVLQSGVGGLTLDSSAALVAALIAGTSEQVLTGAIGKAGEAIKPNSATPTR